VGGGGLIAGIATAIKTLSPSTKIIVRNFFSMLNVLSFIEIFRGLNPINVHRSQKVKYHKKN
jgi:hypothetical protein